MDIDYHLENITLGMPGRNGLDICKSNPSRERIPDEKPRPVRPEE
jgi:hypothetical protein